MREKTELKQKAIVMRRKGNTYSEILERIPVAKSTLSLWLHDVGLAKHQKQRLTQKKLEASRRGGEAKRKQRIENRKNITEKAYKDIGKLSERELFLIGIILYWAEGSKEKIYHPGSGVIFTNMDKRVIRVFLSWLRLCGIEKNSITFELTIHESHTERLHEIISFWAKATGYPKSYFKRIYTKKGNPATKRYNTGNSYYGIIRVRPRTSSGLLRKIEGWTNGIYEDINKRAH